MRLWCEEAGFSVDGANVAPFHRLILTYLIAASLPLGFFPSLELLQEFDLDDQFARLIDGLKVSFCRSRSRSRCSSPCIASQRGNFPVVLSELDRWQAWHLKRGNYLLLKEKLEVICWRNLARRT